MRLADALRIVPPQTIAFTGAGGKSTAMACLETELSVDHPIIITTTTKIHKAQSKLARTHIIAREARDLKSLLPMLEMHRSVLISGDAVEGEDKWLGIEPGMFETVRQYASKAGAILLVEADGARGRSLKAPATYEPVIPSDIDTVVPVAGIDVVGEQLNDDHIHRPEIVGSSLGLEMGDRIRPAHIAALLSHPKGGLKGISKKSEIRVLLNKVETQTHLKHGREIAKSLLTSPRISGVVLGAVAQDPPVQGVYGRVAGIVLAAGSSKRLRQPKQLIQWRDRSLVWHAVQAAVGGGLSPIVVVVGAQADHVRRVLAEDPVTFAHNSDWESGQGSSVRTGLTSIEDRVEAVVILLADMPFVEAKLVQALVKRHRKTLSPLVAPHAGGRRANPVLFDQATFPSLRVVSGDHGGRDLFQRFSVSRISWDDSILFDVDTPEDLRRLMDME